MRTFGYIVRITNVEVPPCPSQWRGIAWIERKEIAMVLAHYLNGKFRHSDKVRFDAVNMRESEDWVLLDEQVDFWEEVWLEYTHDEQWDDGPLLALTPGDIDRMVPSDLRYFVSAKRKEIELADVDNGDLDILARQAAASVYGPESAASSVESIQERTTAQIPIEIDGDLAEFRPASWFPKGMAARLRMAAGKDRKTKRVDSRVVDGVTLYSVSDARLWWPGEVPKEAQG